MRWRNFFQTGTGRRNSDGCARSARGDRRALRNVRPRCAAAARAPNGGGSSANRPAHHVDDTTSRYPSGRARQQENAGNRTAAGERRDRARAFRVRVRGTDTFTDRLLRHGDAAGRRGHAFKSDAVIDIAAGRHGQAWAGRLPARSCWAPVTGNKPTPARRRWVSCSDNS